MIGRKRGASRMVYSPMGRFGGYGRESVPDPAGRQGAMSFGIELPQLAPDMSPIYREIPRRETRSSRMADERRRIAEREAPLYCRDGVRASAALMAVVVLALVLTLAWSVDRREYRAAHRRCVQLEARIDDVDRRFVSLQQEYETRAANIDIGYEAVDLGMISSKGAVKIPLYTPENAQITRASTDTASGR